MTPFQRREDETMDGYTIRLIREEERERCAKIAEAYVADYDDDDEGSMRPVGMNIAAAIRKQE